MQTVQIWQEQRAQTVQIWQEQRAQSFSQEEIVSPHLFASVLMILHAAAHAVDVLTCADAAWIIPKARTAARQHQHHSSLTRYAAMLENTLTVTR